MKKEPRMLIHRVPEYLPGTEVRMRYFRTVTEAKTFAKDQCRALGHVGYTVESLTADVVIGLLEELVPVPGHFIRKAKKVAA